MKYNIEKHKSGLIITDKKTHKYLIISNIVLEQYLNLNIKNQIKAEEFIITTSMNQK